MVNAVLDNGSVSPQEPPGASAPVAPPVLAHNQSLNSSHNQQNGVSSSNDSSSNLVTGADAPSGSHEPGNLTPATAIGRVPSYPSYNGDLSPFIQSDSNDGVGVTASNNDDGAVVFFSDDSNSSDGLPSSPYNGSLDTQPLSPVTREYTPLSHRIHKLIDAGDPFFSLEFFPPRTINGVSNLLPRLERMGEGGPLFVDVTWHAAGDPGSDKATSSSSIAGACLNYCLLETMLHLTCAQYNREQVLAFLHRAKSLGIRNILALRGDCPDDDNGHSPYKCKELRYASDLVRLIRQEFDDYFVICVAGYPTGHPEAQSYEDDLLRLKEKVDAGADFVITQLFFRVEQYFKFVRDCRALGIDVPIIPGIMPIQSYDSLRHICKLSKLDVPSFIVDAVEPIRQNDIAVRNFGVSLAVDMVKQLLSGDLAAPGIHLYTLNREVASREILKATGLWREATTRILPWKPCVNNHKRCREDVRPIFWSSRPKSYLYRTQDWDDFPNGRWGDSTSPAYGDLKDYYLFNLQGRLSKDEQLKMWGKELTSEQDVWKVFQNFITGSENTDGVKVTRLPWSEEDTLAEETILLRDTLKWCNANGILTINSQPNVNGAPSTDPVVGWGNPGGYVYQKAYLEFFMDQSNLSAFLKVLPKFPSVNFHILNHDGSINICNSSDQKPIAVTWGVFAGMEIHQPTIVDPVSFHFWKDEAFDAWSTTWAKLYPEGSQSRNIIGKIHDTYVLVNMVDNNYPNSSCLGDLLSEMLACRNAAAIPDDTSMKQATGNGLADSLVVASSVPASPAPSRCQCREVAESLSFSCNISSVVGGIASSHGNLSVTGSASSFRDSVGLEKSRLRRQHSNPLLETGKNNDLIWKARKLDFSDVVNGDN